MLNIALRKGSGENKAYSNTDADILKEGIEMFCESSIDRVNTRRLGSRLSHFRNRVVDQMAFDCTIKGGTNYWFVQSHGGCGGSGVSVSANLYAGEIVDPYQRPNEIGVALSGENTSTTYTTSTNSDANPDLDWLEGSRL